MANPKPKTTPQERLAKILKQNGKVSELREFREQCRDLFRLGGVIGLDHWIEARRNLNLLTDKAVLKAADDLQGAIGSVIDAATVKPQPKSSELTWEERFDRINKREEHQRNHVPRVGCYVTRRPLSCAERMAAAYDELQRRGAP